MQISRTMKKTQTYLVEMEKVLREKTSAVQSQSFELDRLESERRIIRDRKDKAQRAYIWAEQQRTAMLNHFEKDQSRREAEQREEQRWREDRRNIVEDLGN
jgi:hypothetical protein